MLLIAEHNRFDLANETLIYIFGAAVILVLFAVGLYKRPAIYEMLAIMQDEFWYDGDRRLAADQLFVQFVRTYGAVLPMGSIIMCASPLVWVLQHKDIGSQNANIYNTWMPWEPTLTRYTVLYVVQFIISSSALAYIARMAFSMMMFVNELHVQMDILVDTVRELDVDDMYKTGKLDPDRTRRSYEGLVKCVKHHQTLIK